jgi:hypothetical protein
MNQSQQEVSLSAVRAQFGQNLVIRARKEEAAEIRGFSHCKG